jgi:hypothetical protein
VVVVGGGAALCDPALRGASQVIIPPHAAVANAVGAAVPQISGTFDAMYDMGGTAASRAEVLHRVEEAARAMAVAAGAMEGSCWVASREEVPLAYLPGTISRVRIKVVGDLNLASLDSSEATRTGSSAGREDDLSGGKLTSQQAGQPDAGEQHNEAAVQPFEPGRSRTSGAGLAEGWPPLYGRGDDPSPAQLSAWQPEVNSQGEWLLHSEDLHLIAVGCGILGCGGGGSPGRALLKALMQLQRCGSTHRVLSCPSSASKWHPRTPRRIALATAEPAPARLPRSQVWPRQHACHTSLSRARRSSGGGCWIHGGTHRGH